MPRTLPTTLRHLTCAQANPLPPLLASQFTTAQLSVMTIIADVAGVSGTYVGTHMQLAEAAGVSVGAVRNALRMARKTELIELEQTPNADQRYTLCTLSILSRDWKSWLEAGFKKPPRKLLLSLLVDADIVERLGQFGSHWPDWVNDALRRALARQGEPTTPPVAPEWTRR